MENVCHTLFGWALARAGIDRATPLATATLIAASNLPDVDSVSLWWGDLAYLEHHRGLTHSLVGLAVQGPVLAGAFVAYDRIWRRRRTPDASPAKFGALTLVALVGLFAHLLLDWTNAYGVKPLLPFDESWFYGDLVFIVDPWLWLLLGGAIFLGSRRDWMTQSGWGLLFAGMAAAVGLSLSFRGGETGGGLVVWFWFALLGGLVAARVRWRNAPARALARSALAGVATYWLLLGVAHAVAVGSMRRSQPAPAVIAAPTLMRPDRWRGYAVSDSEIRVFRVGLGGDIAETAAYRRNLDDPRVRAALGTCPGAVALAFNRLLYAEVSTADDGSHAVALRDARFATIPGQPGFATTSVRLEASGTPSPDARPCPRGIWPW